MSGHKLRITNPSGVLVLDAQALQYGYMGQPSLVSAGYISGGVHQPHVYQITLNGGYEPPIVVIVPQSNIATMVYDVALVSGSTWRIEVFCVNLIGHSEDMRNTPQATPQIFVFGPMLNSGAGWKLRLRNSVGRVTFDTGFRPLWLRGAVGFPARSGNKYAGASWTNPAYFNGDAGLLPAGVSVPGVIGHCRGTAEAMISEAGEPTDVWHYGWSRSGSSLLRYRFWGGTSRPYHSLDWSSDDVTYELGVTTAPVMDLAGF